MSLARLTAIVRRPSIGPTAERLPEVRFDQPGATTWTGRFARWSQTGHQRYGGLPQGDLPARGARRIVSMQPLAGELQVSGASVTNMIKRLSDLKLVRTNPTKARN